MRIGSKIAIFLTIVVASIYIGYMSYNKYQERLLYNSVEKSFVGKPSPILSGVTLDGESWSLSDQIGKKVVIVFWHSWNKQSKKQMKFIEEFKKMHKDDDNIELITYCLDDRKSLDEIKVFLKQKEVTFKILYNPKDRGFNSKIAKMFKLYRTPSMWIIDEKGIVREHNLRSIATVERQLRQISKLDSKMIGVNR
jgi:peroxiredoxin